jgi:hypothetical protein
VVRLVVEKKTGHLFACKSISKAKLITKEDVDDVRREVPAAAAAQPPPWLLPSAPDGSSAMMLMEES